MTSIDEAAREGNPAADPQDPEFTAQSRACARASVPPTSLLPSDPATQRGQMLRAAMTRTAAFLDRPGSLAHAHPHSLARARERHHEAAARHTMVPALRVLRLTWGYFHLLLIKPALNFAEWATETPLRFSGLLALGLVIWIWS